QTGAAETVDRHASSGHRQAAADSRQTRHILALCAFVEGRTEDNVFNNGRIDTGTLDCVLDDVTGHVDTVRVVQGTAVGLAQCGTSRRYDNCVSHGVTPV